MEVSKKMKKPIVILLVVLIVVLLGSIGSYAGTDSSGTFKRIIPEKFWYFESPSGIVVDDDGNVYISDDKESTVRKYDKDGNFLNELGGPGSEDGSFNSPQTPFLDGDGNIYIVDSLNQRIQKFDKDGNFLMKFGSYGNGDGQFYRPSCISVGEDGNIYVLDFNRHLVQKFDNDGNFITKWGSSGWGDGQFTFPYGMVLDGKGYIYVSDAGGNRIQKFDTNGNFVKKWGRNGTGNGQFNWARGMAIDEEGNIYVADSDNNRVQVFDEDGNFLRKWGEKGGEEGNFKSPAVLDIDSEGNVYVGESRRQSLLENNHRIQKFTSDGIFISKWGSPGSDVGELYSPADVKLDKNGNIYVADVGNSRIQKFNSDIKFMTSWKLEGNSSSEFSTDFDIDVTEDGTVYVMNLTNSSVQKFDSDGSLIKKWGSAGSEDGQFNRAEGITLDSDENVYVADTGNKRIQKFTSDGELIKIYEGKEREEGEYVAFSKIQVDSNGDMYILNSSSGIIEKYDSEGEFIGKLGTIGYEDGEFLRPEDIMLDGKGNIYVADYGNKRIQKLTTDGNFIEKWGSEGVDDNQFNGPHGMDIDSNGNIYVADRYNNRIQKLEKQTPTTHTVTFDSIGGSAVSDINDVTEGNTLLEPASPTKDGFTFAGWYKDSRYTTKWNFDEDTVSENITLYARWTEITDGFKTIIPEKIWYFESPDGIVVDDDDNVYISDEIKSIIRKYDKTGKLLNEWGSMGDEDGSLNWPTGLALDGDGNIYVADFRNSRIQKFDRDGNFLMKFGSKGSEDGQFNGISCVSVDVDGNIYVLETQNNRVQKFDKNGKFIKKWGSKGSEDGQFYVPYGMELDGKGNMYISDTYNNRIQKFDTSGNFISKWGNAGSGDGQFNLAHGMAIDEDGNIYVADSDNKRVQVFDEDGNFLRKWGEKGDEDGNFQLPAVLDIDSEGNVYVGDLNNDRVQKFTSDGTFVSKWGSYGLDGGEFKYTEDVKLDKIGNLYVADLGNSRIQKFNSDRKFVTSWKIEGDDYFEFAMQFNIDVAEDGTVYVMNSTNNSVQKFDSDGNLIKKWGSEGSEDGQFKYAKGIALDSDENVYVADTGNTRIQKFTSDGELIKIYEGQERVDEKHQHFDQIQIDSNGDMYILNSGYGIIEKYDSEGNFIGEWGTSGSNDGEFERPMGIMLDGKGNIYVADSMNNRVQKLTTDGKFIEKWGSKGDANNQFSQPYGMDIDSNGNIYVADRYNHRIQMLENSGSTEYTVTFDSIGGSAVSDINDVTEGSSVSEPASPTKDGFTFAGWYKDSRYTTKWNFDEDTVSENITLYARWTEQPLVVVPTVVTSGAATSINITSARVSGNVIKNGNGKITEIGIVYGKNANPVIGTDNVTTSSATTVGEFTVSLTGLKAGTTYYARAYAVNEAGTGYGSDITFTTKTEAIPTYTVTFDSIGGSAVSDINDVTEGSSVSEPASPTKDGFTFAGWYKDSRYTTKWKFDEDTVNENITLYARWTEQPLVVAPTVVTSGAATSINITSAKISGNITKDGNGKITEIGIVYGKNVNPVIGTDNVTTSSATTVGEFTVSLTGLKAETTYHARAYAINEAGTGYGNDMTFTTNSKPIPTYTVKFDSQGGSAVLDINDVTEGSTVSEPVAPNMNRHVFNGWYKESSGVNKWNFSVDKVTADITLYAKWTRIPRDSDSGRSSSSGNSTSDTQKRETGIKVIVNGEVQNAGKEIVKEEKGRKEVELVVDANVVNRKIEEIIKSQLGMTDENKKEANNIIEVPVSNENADKITTTLTGDMIKNMDENHFKLVVKVKGIDYIIPAKEVKIEEVAKTLGVKEESLKEIKVEVKIEKSDLLVSEGMEKTAKQNNYEIVVSPVDFKVVAKTTSKDGKENEVEVSRFNKYVERVMEIPENTDPNKITTGIVYNGDGSFSHVPTSVYNNNKAYFARINSLTNSNYSVIWNPIEVKSVENHWAKESVNDMASRLIIFDPEEFNPDDSITRADFAEYIVRALGLYRKDGDHENNFSDVEISDERAIGILTANEYGIVTGYPDGTFKPNGKISREEAMVMYQRAMNITELVGEDLLQYENYTDYKTVSDWAQNNVKTVLSAHVFNGKNETSIEPKSDLTYAEAAEAIRNLLVESELINK